MSDKDLVNRVKELSQEWKKTKEPRCIQEAISMAKKIKEGQAKSFLVILLALAGAN